MSTSQGFIDPKTYPPTQITTTDGVINILQLTDPHLYLDSDTETVGINNYQSFTACLQQALEEDIRCDLILLSGDLVNEVKPEIYQNIYQLLEKTGIPFVCIAGNHDVTDELDTHLPFSERRFVAHKPNALLLSRHCLTLNDWRLLLIDSSVPGKIYGAVGNKNLNWLSQNIANSHHPVIIAMHHHVLPIDSAWMDDHITQDAEVFWHLIEDKPSVKAVVTGHVHQKFEAQRAGVKVYATPSTCYQFKPKSDNFAFDDQAAPGYRWLSLNKQGVIQSWITRLENKKP